MLGGNALNTTAINASGTAGGPGSGTLIAIRQTIVEPNEGTLIFIEQQVIDGGEGTLIEIEQTVIFNNIESGTLIFVEQLVGTIASGQLIKVEQLIKNSAISAPTHISRFGWDVLLLVGGNQVPCQTGMINIQRTEGGASLMDVTFMPGVGSGVQDVEGYAGLDVTLNIETSQGNFRAYTGIVDIGEVDIINKSITLRCTDRRSELINTQLGAAITAYIGFYSTVIFPPPKDTFEELNNRLTTTPLTVDFDAYGNFNIADINPKPIADFHLTGSPPNGVFYRDPKVEYTSRARLTNKVNIKFQYRYPRLWQVERRWSWHTTASICDVLLRGYTMARRDMISQAAHGGGWPLHGDVAFEPVTPSGFYCGVVWSTVHLSGTTEKVVDKEGKQITDTVTDTEGNSKEVPRTTTRITGGSNVGALLADGASWAAAKRWSQVITENYAITVAAPQSISQYGEIEAFSQYATEDYTDKPGIYMDNGKLYKVWDEFTVWDNPFGKGTSVEAQNYFVDITLGRGLANAALMTAVSIARTTILKSHRDTRVTVLRSLWPQVDLKHTVSINANITNGGSLVAKGKVYTIEHSLNLLTGEAFTKVVLALSRSRGDVTVTPLKIPEMIPNDTMPDSSDILLGNHFGEDPSEIDVSTGEQVSATWTGYVGNKIVNRFGFVPSRSNYNLQFINTTPDIDDSFRIARELSHDPADGLFDIAIPNDTLIVSF